MNVSFPTPPYIRTPLLKEIMIGERRIQTLPPGFVRLSIHEKELIEELVRKAALQARTPLPPLIRVDGVLLNNEYKVFEINSDHPVGLGFLLHIFTAYGYPKETERITQVFNQFFGDRTVIFVQERSALFSKHEIPVLTRYFPNSRSYILENKRWERHAKNKSYYLIRTSGKNFRKWYRNWPQASMNPKGSWAVGDKTILDQIQSPLLLKSSVVKIAKRKIVPQDYVAKLPFGRHGEAVFFPGEEIKKGTYLFQEKIQIPQRAFGRERFLWGVDFFLLEGKVVAAFGRVCSPKQQRLNVGAGGGLSGFILTG